MDSNYIFIVKKYFMMELIFALLPLVGIFIFYLIPAIFIIWFLFKLIKIQQEQTEILKSISDKLNRNI